MFIGELGFGRAVAKGSLECPAVVDITMVPRIENQSMSILGEQVGDSAFKAFLPGVFLRFSGA